MINKTSAVENAETSSVGRMLANLGLHGGSYASHEEVKNAIDAQDTLKKNENVVELKTNNPITQNDVTQHQDRKGCHCLFKRLQSKWQKTLRLVRILMIGSSNMSINLKILETMTCIIMKNCVIEYKNTEIN